MRKNIIKLALSAAAVVALPGAALAGTSTATNTATFNVINQCSVTGATVNLGTFTVNQTLADVAAEIGRHNGGTAGIVGTRGQEYANWGSVTCNNGTPYTLTISGTAGVGGTPGGIKLTIGSSVVNFLPYVKKIGATTVPNNAWGGGDFGAYSGAGASVVAPAATGTGTAQQVLGSVLLAAHQSPALTTQLGTAGSYTDTLSYVLNF